VTSFTSKSIAYDREGPRGDPPVVLIHAGVADRGMWDPVWPMLSEERDVVRVDLRGFGDSAVRPADPVSQADDVLAALSEIGIDRCHLVGASFGAGVAVEAALTRPAAAASLVLAPPAGSLLEMTPGVRAFIDEEMAAVERGDLDAAVELNLSWWVDGPCRHPDQVDPEMRALVGHMQRRVFEVTCDWDDVEEIDLEPPGLDRLSEVSVPVLVLVGGLDHDTVRDAAGRVVSGVAGARLVEWPQVGHLPPLERPADFADLLRDWAAELARARP